MAARTIPTPQKPKSHLRPMPDDYLAAESMEDLLRGTSREAIRRLRWQMEHGPTLVCKERAAATLAKLCVPRPPQRVEHTGVAGGAPIQSEHRITFVEAVKK